MDVGVDSLLSLTRLFADDSSLFYSASSLDDIQGLINHDLISLSQWAKQWLVTFNPSKTEAILFTLKNLIYMPLLKFENTFIKFVESHKHLGLTLSFNGKWTDHLYNVKSSAAKVLGIMRKLKFSLKILIFYRLWNTPPQFGMVVPSKTLKCLTKFKMKQPESLLG